MKHCIFALFTLLPSALFSHEYKVERLEIAHPFSFERTSTSSSSAGYLEITNGGTEDDRLISVKADFPRVMVHNTITENDITKMVHIDGLDIRAGETVQLKPGGMHIMFMGKTDAHTHVGETFPVTLTFQNAGDVVVDFKVESRETDHNQESSVDSSQDSTHNGH